MADPLPCRRLPHRKGEGVLMGCICDDLGFSRNEKFPDDHPYHRGYVGRDKYDDLDWVRITFPMPLPETLIELADAFEKAYLDGTADFLMGLVRIKLERLD